MLKERVTSLDEVPEGLREHYGPAQDGDGFEIQIQDAGALVNALNSERQRRRDVEHKAAQHQSRSDQLVAEVKALTAQLHDANVTAEHLRLAHGIKRREDMTPREQFLDDAGNRLAGLQGEARTIELAKIEQELGPLIAEERTEIDKPWRTRVEGLRSTVQRLTRESAATDLIMRMRRPGIHVEALMPIVLARIEAEERDGDFAAIAKDASGQPMSLDALAEELRATPALAPLVLGGTPEEKAAHERKVRETLGQK